MNAYLLDMNHVSAVIKKNSLILKKIRELPSNTTLGIAMPSIAELWFMVFNSVKVEQNKDDLIMVLSGLARFDFSENAAVDFGRVKSQPRKKGRPIPDADSQIAAIARVNDLVVLTSDAHCNNVSNLKTLNWLS